MYLGFDISTQSLKAVIIDSAKRIHIEAAINYDQHLPHFGTKGGVIRGDKNLCARPQDEKRVVTAPSLMFVAAMELVLQKLQDEGAPLDQVVAISGSGQQHGSMWWRDGARQKLQHLSSAHSLSDQLADAFSLSHGPIWMDSSTEEECANLERELGGGQAVADITGSRAYERFTGNQIAKICSFYPLIYANTERISLVSSGMASLLLGDYAPIDSSDGSGMNLMDIQSCKWNERILEIVASPKNDFDQKIKLKIPARSDEMDIPAKSLSLEDRLGSPCAPHTILGNIHKYYAEKFHFNPNCKIVAFSGDNNCSLVGLNLSQPGDVGVSLGTSDTLMATIPKSKVKPSGKEGHVFTHPLREDLAMVMLCWKNGSLAREHCRDHALNSNTSSITLSPLPINLTLPAPAAASGTSVPSSPIPHQASTSPALATSNAVSVATSGASAATVATGPASSSSSSSIATSSAPTPPPTLSVSAASLGSSIATVLSSPYRSHSHSHHTFTPLPSSILWQRFNECLSRSTPSNAGRLLFYYLDAEITPTTSSSGIVRVNAQNGFVSSFHETIAPVPDFANTYRKELHTPTASSADSSPAPSAFLPPRSVSPAPLNASAAASHAPPSPSSSLLTSRSPSLTSASLITSFHPSHVQMAEIRALVETQFLSMRFHSQSMGLDKPRRIVATGGGASNMQLLQVLADIFQTDVFVFRALRDRTPAKNLHESHSASPTADESSNNHNNGKSSANSQSNGSALHINPSALSLMDSTDDINVVNTAALGAALRAMDAIQRSQQTADSMQSDDAAIKVGASQSSAAASVATSAGSGLSGLPPRTSSRRAAEEDAGSSNSKRARVSSDSNEHESAGSSVSSAALSLSASASSAYSLDFFLACRPRVEYAHAYEEMCQRYALVEAKVVESLSAHGPAPTHNSRRRSSLSAMTSVPHSPLSHSPRVGAISQPHRLSITNLTALSNANSHNQNTPPPQTPPPQSS